MSRKETISEQPWPPTPDQSPLFRAAQSSRYERRDDIQLYEQVTGRSMVVFWGPIFPYCIPYFFDAVTDTDTKKPLDLMLTTRGGDPETALRMAIVCRKSNPNFRVIVPDIAASSGTLLALAADSVMMSSLSSLGPIDPQLYLQGRNTPVSAKAIITIANEINEKVLANNELFELLLSLLADIDATIIQKAQDAVKRTAELVPELIQLRQNPPSDQAIQETIKKLQDPASHSAAINYDRATTMGIPTEYIEPKADEWDVLWRLHTKYVTKYGPSIGPNNIIEGHSVSYEVSPPGAL